MADAVVTFLLENLSQLLRQEIESLHGVKDELQSLSVQLELMRSFLRDFESVQHESVETVVNQIRDLAYDAEDVIDDYVAYTLKYGGNWRWHLPGSSILMKKRDIGKRIKDIKKRTDKIHDTKDKLGIEIKLASEASGEGLSRRRRRRAPIVEEADVVGFTNEVQLLVKRLIGGDLKRAAISIIGMGGLGKTTLAKKIYNDAFIKDSFKHRGWVYVSQEHTLAELILGILKCLTNVTERMNQMNEEDLGRVLHNRLKGKKYLIVMDDVWKPQVWEHLRPFFPDDVNGSRILLTTRVTEVAVYADSDRRNPPHYLRLLDPEESWKLFSKKALLGDNCS